MDNISMDVIRTRITLLGVKIDVLSLDQLLTALESCIPNHHQTVISNVNVHAVNIAYSLPWFREFLNRSEITFCDGVGLKLAARLTGQGRLYRYTPPDFMERIFEIAARSGWKIFLLGAKLENVQHTAKLMMEKYPTLLIDVHHGYFDKSAQGMDNMRVVNQINQFKPQLLVLGFGMPMQEKWILENMSQLNVNVYMPAGALFDYLSGDLPRAPRWITDNGLEWLGRLLIEPRRLWKRYLVGNPLFFWRLFIHHFLKFPLPK
jgi:N-acetylglucosaminyldiphosphoundecaprenol N-acetyl-beta-D-mannosaminyltransferase